MGLRNEKHVIALFKFLAIACIIGIVSITIYYYHATKGYPYLNEKASFADEVISAESLRGDTRVKLANGLHFTLPYADNYAYQRSRLSDFVREGDILIKKKDSDTLIVKRFNEQYYFVINRAINDKE